MTVQLAGGSVDDESRTASSRRVLEAGDRLERDVLAAAYVFPSLKPALEKLPPEHFDSDAQPPCLRDALLSRRARSRADAGDRRARRRRRDGGDRRDHREGADPAPAGAPSAPAAVQRRPRRHRRAAAKTPGNPQRGGAAGLAREEAGPVVRLGSNGRRGTTGEHRYHAAAATAFPGSSIGRASGC